MNVTKSNQDSPGAGPSPNPSAPSSLPSPRDKLKDGLRKMLWSVVVDGPPLQSERKAFLTMLDTARKMYEEDPDESLYEAELDEKQGQAQKSEAKLNTMVVSLVDPVEALLLEYVRAEAQTEGQLQLGELTTKMKNQSRVMIGNNSTLEINTTKLNSHESELKSLREHFETRIEKLERDYGELAQSQAQSAEQLSKKIEAQQKTQNERATQASEKALKDLDAKLSKKTQADAEIIMELKAQILNQAKVSEKASKDLEDKLCKQIQSEQQACKDRSQKVSNRVSSTQQTVEDLEVRLFKSIKDNFQVIQEREAKKAKADELALQTLDTRLSNNCKTIQEALKDQLSQRAKTDEQTWKERDARWAQNLSTATQKATIPTQPSSTTAETQIAGLDARLQQVSNIQTSQTANLTRLEKLVNEQKPNQRDEQVEAPKTSKPAAPIPDDWATYVRTQFAPSNPNLVLNQPPFITFDGLVKAGNRWKEEMRKTVLQTVEEELKGRSYRLQSPIPAKKPQSDNTCDSAPPGPSTSHSLSQNHKTFPSQLHPLDTSPQNLTRGRVSTVPPPSPAVVNAPGHMFSDQQLQELYTYLCNRFMYSTWLTELIKAKIQETCGSQINEAVQRQSAQGNTAAVCARLANFEPTTCVKRDEADYVNLQATLQELKNSTFQKSTQLALETLKAKGKLLEEQQVALDKRLGVVQQACSTVSSMIPKVSHHFSACCLLRDVLTFLRCLTVSDRSFGKAN